MMSILAIPFARFGKFLWTSFTGTVVDTLVVWVLATFLFDDYVGRYVIAPAISFEAAVLNNYAISYFWIWNERVERTGGDFFSRLLIYNANSFLVFLLKLALLLVVEWISGFHVVYCNLIALMVTGLLNFFLQNKFIFKSRGVGI